MSHATPVRRRFALLLALAAATSVAWTEPRPDTSDTHRDGTKQEAQPVDPEDRPVPPPDSVAPNDSPNSAPAQPPAAAPSRDSAKPSRPASKPRPAWPPPPELIS